MDNLIFLTFRVIVALLVESSNALSYLSPPDYFDLVNWPNHPFHIMSNDQVFLAEYFVIFNSFNYNY